MKQRKTRDENSIKENIVMYPLFELKIKYHNISFISGSKLSISSISPFFMIKITSQSVMVFKRWAIVITVESFNFSFTTFHIVCSAFGSTCAVGSSKIIISLWCNRTRARQINCRSPTLKFAPCSNNSWSSPSSSLSTNSYNCTSSRARHNLYHQIVP